MNIKKAIALIVLAAVFLQAVLLIYPDSKYSGISDKLSWERKQIETGLSAELRSLYAHRADKTNAQTEKNGQTDKAIVQETMPPFPTEADIPDVKKEEEEKEKGTQRSDGQLVILPTTIEGGMVIKNETSYELDLNSLVKAGTSVKLSATGPQILIIHTHGSEAYTSDGKDSYALTDNFRTEDKKYSVIRVGDELCSSLESYGLRVIHDRNIYDYPSYTGSYAKSGDAIEKYLKQYPSISVVLDVHRDSIGSGDAVYKTIAEANGEPCSQVMLLAGTGENGLEHPNWEENLKFALYLQSAIVKKYPTLARPIALEKERYNQQLTTGSLILEVGSSGNTLSEALNAVRLFADAAGPALKEKCEKLKS